MVVEALSVDPPEPQGGEPGPPACPATTEQPSPGAGQWTAMTAVSNVASGSGSIETSRSSSLQQLAGCATPSIIEAASVRQKAQFFEALIRTNTDTLIRVRGQGLCVGAQRAWATCLLISVACVLGC